MTGSCWRHLSAASANATAWKYGWNRERPLPFIPGCCGAVLDLFSAEGVNHAILDVSASAHMPDTLEMPYRPDVFQIAGDASLRSAQQPAVRLEGESYALAGKAGEKAYTYRLGAPTCLAGDRLGDYSFAEPLAVGDELVFDDMAHYTMVKTTFFNGVRHPDIAVQRKDGSVETVRRFSYEDFEARLG